MNEKDVEKLKELNNPHVVEIVEKYIKLCNPAKVTVITDSKEDIGYVKNLALKNKEESRLETPGHTIHFDGYNDQARDKANTKILLPKGQTISKKINTGDRNSCLKEIFSLMEGIMEGKEMLICFYCLGPVHSRFAIPALQITDSAYVAHSENILYRQGYEQFKSLNGSNDFFSFIHSSGQLEDNVSKNIDKRRIYVDLEKNRVLSVNNQYAGNSVGLKKHSFRLAIKKANQEDWLAEHMFLMGVKQKNRITYFTGAFPSACGKTSTAMIPGQEIIGDDITYIKSKDKTACAVNVEQGIFGIIENVNPEDDPLIYQVLTSPRELIFSNVLINEKTPYWLGMGKDIPEKGFNFAGNWKKGNKDKDGNDIPAANKNARYTIRIEELENASSKLNDTEGVPVSGFIYGGRDSDTSPPVLESFDWQHGVFIGASIESETTAATLGEVGVRKHNPMANLDFLVVPLGLYLKNHLEFGNLLKKPPKIFATNYFLKENSTFLNEKIDKKIWLLWMEGRIHNDFQAIKTPIGFIPKFDDLQKLFRQIFNKNYTKEDYEKQFSIRINKLLERLDRIEKIYKEEKEIPEEIQNHIEEQRKRLLEAKEKYQKDIVSPFEIK